MFKRLIFFALIAGFILPAFCQDNEYQIKLGDLIRKPAGNAYSLNLNQNLRTTDSPTFAGLTLNVVSTSEATLGSTLLTNGDFATNDLTGWTAAAGWSGATGKAVHTAGIADTTALVQAVAMTSGAIYQITFTTSGRTAGTVTMTCGALPTNMNATSTNETWNWSVTAAATTSYNLTFTPTATFDGAIDDISVKLVTANATPLLPLNDSGGNAIIAFRGSATLKNIGIGPLDLNYNTVGHDNITFTTEGTKITTGFYNMIMGGGGAGGKLTASHRNSIYGYANCQNTTSANAITSYGAYAGQFNETGGNWAGFGYCSLSNNKYGTYLSAHGHYSLFGNESGIYNSGFGPFSGAYIADGVTSNKTSDYGTYLGGDTKASVDNAQNETVIGYGATGAGSNTVRLGNTAVTGVYTSGDILSQRIINLDSDTNEIDSLTWAGGYGMVVAACSTDGVTAIWRLEGTTLTAISVNALFTATADAAGTYNVYFTGGAIKIQNKVGDNKVLRLGFFGI